ncbi:MAG: hypothetical protein Q9162_006507 [Coniocarpon cinnabarinum]
MPQLSFSSKPKANPAAVVGAGNHKYRFTVLTEGLLRYEYAADGTFEDRPSFFAVNREQPVPEFRVIESEENLEIITKYYHLYYNKQEFSSRGLRVQVLGGATVSNSFWRYGFHHEAEHYRLGGTTRTLDRIDGRMELGEGVINQNGYADIDDSDSMLFTDDGFVTARRPADGGPRIDGYLFAFGLDYKAAIKALYKVSGSQPLLPRWSLSNWWSRWAPYTDQDYLELMDRFRDNGIPLSVCVLDMDWHWVNEPFVKAAGVSGWTGYSWNTKLLREPKKFLAQMRDKGLRLPACDHPADGVQFYEDVYEEVCKALGVDASTKDPIPFDITHREYVRVYFDIVLKKLYDDGLDFIWQDWQQGPVSALPGVDPIQPLNHFHYHAMQQPDHSRRPFIFSRYAGPGAHRYPVGFSGDAQITWASLQFQPEFTATASNIGFGYWSNDIGGHIFGERDNELAVRWIQLGVLSPINRLHSSINPWINKEPWSYPTETFQAQAAALRLRFQLVPYLYSMVVRATRDDEPLVQPLYWSHPRRIEAYQNKNTFHFGSELLVLPLTTPREQHTKRSSINAFLPPCRGGRYIDIFSGIVYDADRSLTVHRRLDEVAVLAPQGSIIPLAAPVDEKKATFGTPIPDHLHIKVVAGSSGEFHLYEDNGNGDDLAHVNLITTAMKLDNDALRFVICPASGKDIHSVLPEKRTWSIEFIGLDWRCKPVALTSSPNSKELTETTTNASRTDTSLVVTLHSIPVTSEIQIRFGQELKLGVNDVKRLAYERIHEANMAHDPKILLWNAVDLKRVAYNQREFGLGEHASWGARIGNLMAADVPASVRESLLEVLLADGRVMG